MHNMKTRSKAARIARIKAMALRDVEDRCCGLSEAWDASLEKEELIREIEEKVLTQETVFVDSALCLGLGSLELYPENYAEYYDNEEDLIDYCMYESTNRFRQLLIFEKILDCLRSKFKINEVRFQDPAFSLTDVKFLEQRGYLVLPFCWDQARRIPLRENGQEREIAGLDLSLLPVLSPSTMIFAPFLPLLILYDLVYTAKPSLYFGTSLMYCITDKNPSITKVSYPAEDFEDFVTAYEDELEVTAFAEQLEAGDCPLVLTWPALTNDREAMIRLQNRRLAVEKAKEARLNGGSDSDSETESTSSE